MKCSYLVGERLGNGRGPDAMVRTNRHLAREGRMLFGTGWVRLRVALTVAATAATAARGRRGKFDDVTKF